MKPEKEMFDLILEIAAEDERIRAVYLTGSRANPKAGRDKYQDYDIVFVVTETKTFLENKSWLSKFGEISFLFEGEWNRQQFFGIDDPSIFDCRYVFCMLLKDGNRVDLVIEIKAEAKKSFAENRLTEILLDKDDFLPAIPPASDEDYYVKKPCENQYRACCTGFWWFLNDVAKGIARDQLPFAMDSFTSFIRPTLNQMVDWYIGIQTDFSVSTGKGGKYYKKYLPQDLYTLYEETYSDSNYANFWKSIFSACRLFNKIALDVGKNFSFIYNQQEEDSIKEYLENVKADCHL
jgi:aminoglycoside 6-adenylyltransferase